VLVATKAGFEAAARATQRRARLGDTPAEGYAPYVLSALGGASAMFLWLKLSVLAGLRADSTVTFRWSFLVAAGVLGAILGLIAQFAWGAAGAGFIRRLGGDVTAREIRMVWGASAFPQVFGLLILVPLDLIIVGPSTFTSEKLSDSVASAWAALSIAIALSLMLWSLYLFVKGVSVVSGIRFRKALLASTAALLCLGLVLVAFRFGALALAGS
jgi:hypothetical protein